MFCRKCGTENDDNAYRCVKCGEFLHPEDRGPSRSPRTSGLAIASLVTSIAGVFMCFLVGQIVGIILGHQARRQIDNSEGWITGEGMARAGIIVGWAGIALDIGIILVIVILAVVNI